MMEGEVKGGPVLEPDAEVLPPGEIEIVLTVRMGCLEGVMRLRGAHGPGTNATCYDHIDDLIEDISDRAMRHRCEKVQQ